jgi:hypothetical protein
LTRRALSRFWPQIGWHLKSGRVLHQRQQQMLSRSALLAFLAVIATATSQNCSDGILNGNETQVDRGGECNSFQIDGHQP